MRRALYFAALTLVTALLASACGPWFSFRFRAGVDHIKIPHAKHAAAKVECIACHSDIYDAPDLKKHVLPKEDDCLSCHRAEKDKGNCQFCHTDVSKAAPWPVIAEPSLRMSHAKHIDLVKEKCDTCHTALPNPLRAAEAAPAMAACLNCHEHKVEYDEGRCNGCHVDLQRKPLEPISRFTHQGNFVREHARPARAATATCAECHEQTFCSDCHANTVSTKIEDKQFERVDRDFIHRNDFLSRHSVEAQADPVTCARCHGTSFCDSCHRAQNLTPQATNPRDPHPSGWLWPASAQFHGVEARRDISQCAACHDQGTQSICLDCHKVGGSGGNPHPAGWTARHGRNEIARNGMCVACHQ